MKGVRWTRTGKKVQPFHRLYSLASDDHSMAGRFSLSNGCTRWRQMITQRQEGSALPTLYTLVGLPCRRKHLRIAIPSACCCASLYERKQTWNITEAAKTKCYVQPLFLVFFAFFFLFFILFSFTFICGPRSQPVCLESFLFTRVATDRSRIWLTTLKLLPWGWRALCCAQPPAWGESFR